MTTTGAHALIFWLFFWGGGGGGGFGVLLYIYLFIFCLFFFWFFFLVFFFFFFWLNWYWKRFIFETDICNSSSYRIIQPLLLDCFILLLSLECSGLNLNGHQHHHQLLHCVQVCCQHSSSLFAKKVRNISRKTSGMIIIQDKSCPLHGYQSRQTEPQLP